MIDIYQLINVIWVQIVGMPNVYMGAVHAPIYLPSLSSSTACFDCVHALIVHGFSNSGVTKKLSIRLISNSGSIKWHLESTINHQ